MHINTEIAFDLMEGRLELSSEQQWTQHVNSCSPCQASMNAWAELRTDLKRPHLETAPRHMLVSALGLFQPQSYVAGRSGIRQILAALTFDNFTQPAFAGARGEAATRQVVLRAEEFDIHVRISATKESRELLGQIQARGTKTFVDHARLHLLQNGERISSAEVNELGEFYFTFVPDGFLSLQIDLPHLTVIGALDVNDKI